MRLKSSCLQQYLQERQGDLHVNLLAMFAEDVFQSTILSDWDENFQKASSNRNKNIGQTAVTVDPSL